MVNMNTNGDPVGWISKYSKEMENRIKIKYNQEHKKLGRKAQTRNHYP